MSGSCTVIPGIDWSAQGVDYANLNLAANPIVQVDAESITDRELNLAGLVSKLGDRLVSKNYLLNGNFDLPFWDDGLAPLTSGTGVKTTLARYWWVKQTGGTLTYEPNTTSPATPSYYSLKFTGAAGVGDVDFGQDMPAWISRTARRYVVISAYILNNTGAIITPQVRISTADVVDDFSAVTFRTSAAMQAVSASASAWQRVYVAIDLSAVTNAANGLQVVIRIPSGGLDSALKVVQIAQVKMETGVDGSSTPSAYVFEAFDTSVQRKAAGGRPGVNSNAFTGGTLSFTAGTSKIDQKVTGTLASAGILDVLRTGALEGDVLRFKLNVVTSPSNTLTIRENSSGSMVVFNQAKTVSGLIEVKYNGSAWELWNFNTV